MPKIKFDPAIRRHFLLKLRAQYKGWSRDDIIRENSRLSAQVAMLTALGEAAELHRAQDDFRAQIASHKSARARGKKGGKVRHDSSRGARLQEWTKLNPRKPRETAIAYRTRLAREFKLSDRYIQKLLAGISTKS